MSIYNIIQELNENNGSNHKMDVLRKHKDNKTLQRVLKMTYDNVAFTYGVSMKNAEIIGDLVSAGVQLGNIDKLLTLDEALDIIERDLCVQPDGTRKVTGNAAIACVEYLHECVESVGDATVLSGLFDRDLRINMGRSNINKVFKKLIIKPPYMRCGLYNEKTKNRINPKGAYVQLKADGTYREFTVENGKVKANSRSGEEYEHPDQEAVLATYPDNHYIGELTVHNEYGVLDRATGNGMIKANKFPEHHYVVFDAWDVVSLEEYSNAANKIKGTTPYWKRFATLTDIIGKTDMFSNKSVRVIETHIVDTLAEALVHCVRWMKAGLEGAIYKDKDAIFRDGTSPQQDKLKLEIDVDVRWTGFIEGKRNTKREKTFGSATFATDDGKIKGSCSGFTDKQLKEINDNRTDYINKIFTVTCNDITQARDNDHYALSHPRFTEIRDDKDETDTLERALATKQMAMMVGEV